MSLVQYMYTYSHCMVSESDNDLITRGMKIVFTHEFKYSPIISMDKVKCTVLECLAHNGSESLGAKHREKDEEL